MSDDEEYWLGFLYADGCLGRDNRLMASSKDHGHLESLREHMGFGRVRLKADGTSEWYGSNAAARARLEARGLTRRKSLTMTWPRFTEGAAYGPFIRGYFDGDGSIFTPHDKRWPRVAFTSGSATFLAGLRGALATHLISASLRPHGKPGAWRLYIHRHDDVLALGRLMYADGGPRLVRKEIRFAL